MPHRAHLFSLRIGHALRESCFAEPYGRQRFIADVLAGITVGIIAIPLAMALAIATGLPRNMVSIPPSLRDSPLPSRVVRASAYQGPLPRSW